MPAIIAYVRASSNKQDTDHQELEIRRHACELKMEITTVVKVKVSSRKGPVERRIQEVADQLRKGDILIVTEISRLGRSTSEIIQFINQVLNNGIRLIAIKQKLDISRHDMQSKILVTLFSLLADLERDLISLRTKEALAAKKAQGQVLGKPKGTIQKSKFDKDLPRIRGYLKDGVSIRKISKHLGYNNHIGLNNYIRSRKIKQQLQFSL